ncbi:MAG: HPr family phosphocarrier protein [Lachnospiraceae bacterium]|nr:HPr family phosphocarrier protein [Lachnospiraceae bacterium]
MMEAVVLVDSIEKAKKFVSIAERFDEKMDLISDGHALDAKSIMGIFNINLSRPFTLRIYESGEKAENIIEAFREYIVG